MTRPVVLTRDAALDVAALHRYVRVHSGLERARELRDRLRELCSSLSDLAERGHVVPELQQLGINEFREVHWRTYRVVYEVGDGRVIVHLIVDGRRSLQDLLLERLMR